MNHKRTTLLDGWIGLGSSSRSGLVTVAIAATLVFGGTGCARPGPGSAKTPDELLSQLQEDRGEIDKTSDTMMKRIEVFNSSRKPGERTLQFSEIFTQDMNPERRTGLNQLGRRGRTIPSKDYFQTSMAAVANFG